MEGTTRRWMFITVLLCVISTGVVAAQGWKPYAFEQSERYVFRMVQFTQDGYEDDDWTIPRIVSEESRYTVEIRDSGELSAEGQLLYEVSTTMQRFVSQDAVADAVGITPYGYGFGGGLNFIGMFNPLMFMFLEPFFEETEFEVGERMSVFGIGRVSITREETLAGRKGVVVQLETGSAGERELAGEWTVDPDLAMPIAIRTYDQDMLVSEIILDEYVRY